MGRSGARPVATVQRCSDRGGAGRMNFRAGDRVRVETIGDDGLPLVRYGFIGGLPAANGGHPQGVSVMLDGELGAAVIPRCRIQVVSITNVELRFGGSDLMTDPD